MISVMIIDASANFRKIFAEVLSKESDIQVVEGAGDPYEATEKLKQRIPDVIILDIALPRMDGLTFLRKLMKQHPIPVIICSHNAEEGSLNVFKALHYGAVDIIQKPKEGARQFLEEFRVPLADAIRAAQRARIQPVSAILPAPVSRYTADVILPPPETLLPIDTTEPVIVVGASTGGTEALRIFLEALPLDAPGVVIVQHMPELFTAAFASRLDGLCTVTVKEAKNHDLVMRGQVLIAPGNRHLLLKRSAAHYYVEVTDGPLVSRHRPSVDVLFRSAAWSVGKNAIGIIMTGMGDDGAQGLKEMKHAGAFTIAQDEASCVVFGMPKEAIKLGAVHKTVPLEQIGDLVIRIGKNTW